MTWDAEMAGSHAGRSLIGHRLKLVSCRFARWLLAWLPPAISARVIPKYGCILQVSVLCHAEDLGFRV